MSEQERISVAEYHRLIGVAPVAGRSLIGKVRIGPDLRPPVDVGARDSASSKYQAKKTWCAGGHQHDSGREAKRCDVLHLMAKAGTIDGLELQPQFYFVVDGRELKHDNGRRAGYRADFAYRDVSSGRRIVEDSKGASVRDWPLRRALFRHLHPEIELREV